MTAVATLAIPQLVTTIGPLPRPGEGSGIPSFTLGMIQTFAGLYEAFGAPTASGQHLQMASNAVLFSVYGSAFGGGSFWFGLPKLDDTVIVGSDHPGDAGWGTLGMTWLIADGSDGPALQAPFAGTVMAFGGRFAPDGWLQADGSVLQIADHPALFAAIGTTFGGDGTSTFALPNLAGAAPVGTGNAPDGVRVSLGRTVAGDIPGLGLNYLIAVNGIYPEKGGGAVPPDEAFLGQIVAYAGSTVPKNWLMCDGAQLPVGLHAALYSVLGTTYGGDGVASFGLPNLAGRMIRGRAL